MMCKTKFITFTTTEGDRVTINAFHLFLVERGHGSAVMAYNVNTDTDGDRYWKITRNTAQAIRNVMIAK